MSDPQNMPTIGKLKRLGGDDPVEQSPQEIEESADESLEYVDEGGSYVDDQQSFAPPTPGSIPPPPKPEGSGLRLKDRTKSNLDYSEKAEKTKSQFDDYFQQEAHNKSGFLTKIFGSLNNFSPKTRKIFLGATIGLLIIGAALSLKTFFINFIFAVASFQLIRVFSMQEKTLSRFGLFPARVVLTVVFSGLAILLPLSYKWWQSDGTLYLQEIQNSEDLANQSQEKIKEAVDQAGEQVGGHLEGDDVQTHDFQYTDTIVKTFNEKTYLSGSGLLGFYFQYIFFLSALLFAPFIRERDLLKIMPLREDDESISWKFARYFMLRLTKAIIIAVLLAVGLKYAGYQNVFFIAGTTFLLCIITRFGMLLGLIMCIPVIITKFSTTDTGLNSMTILAVTGIITIIVEQKLHWLMVILPMRKDGIVPPSMLKEPKSLVATSESTSSSGGGLRFMANFISIVVSLTIYGSVAFLGYTVYDVYTTQSSDRESLNEALESLPENKEEAFKIIEGYRNDYPNDREVILSLSKAYLKVGNIDKALETAAEFRDFEAVSVNEEEDIIQKVRVEISQFLSKSTRNIKDYEAHKWIIVKFKELYPKHIGSEKHFTIAKAMFKTNPKEIEAFKAIARYYYNAKDFEKTREWCNKGLEVEKDNVRLLCLIVRTHFDEGEKQLALKALMNVDKVTIDDEEANELRRKIINFQP